MDDFKLNSKVIDGEAVSTGTTVTSDAIKLKNVSAKGFFSVQITSASAGAATVKAVVLCSNDGVSFNVPVDRNGTAVDNIVTAHGVGTAIYAFPAIPVCREIKVQFTVSVADVTSLDAVICVQ